MLRTSGCKVFEKMLTSSSVLGSALLTITQKKEGLKTKIPEILELVIILLQP